MAELDDFEIEDGWGDPQAARSEHQVLWLHVAAREQLRLIVLSTSPILYRIHWWGGRANRHTKTGCLFCRDRIGSQVRYCFSVYLPQEQRRACFEIGAYTAGELQELARVFGGLRGLSVVFSKSGGRERGRIEVAKCHLPIEGDLPEAQDVAAILRGAVQQQEDRDASLRSL